jgi:GNAT superfamily N-acetyltransferase
VSELPFGAPQGLRAEHQTGKFDCGKAPLNEFLHRFALINAQSGSARTFVVADENKYVVGYYSLAATAVVHDAAPPRVRQGQPRHPIPAILMARFAVDRSQQGKGLGRELFRDALLRSLNITEELGARAFVVDAKDEDARHFYHRFQMMVDSQDPHRLYLLFKDIKKILAG